MSCGWRTYWLRTAYCAASLGDFDGARDFYLEALALRRSVLDEPHINIVQSLRSIGVTYWRQDQLQRALEITLEARDMLAELNEPHPVVAVSLNKQPREYLFPTWPV